MDLVALGVGGFIGFLSAVGKDFLLERSKNKTKIKDFKRQKLEEIFILMDKVFQETIKPLKYQSSLDGAGAKLGMTIRFYFPELKVDYNNFIQIFQSTSQKTMTLDENVSLTTEEIMTYAKAHRVFLDKVVKESEKYV